MTDYDRLELSRSQRIFAIVAGCVACFAAAWLIFRHPVLSAAASPAGLLYPRMLRNRLLIRRRSKLRLQFKEMLQALSSLLSAGRSVENAFLSLESDLALLVADTRSDLIRELRALSNRLRNGEPLEPLLQDFARRSGLEEVRSFAEAFAVCKRAGGDLVEIVRRTSQLIAEKMEVELEVTVLVAQKRFESRIMMVMPFAFIGLLGFFAPEYMAPLRQGIGWLLTAACLLLLGLCCWWMVRIMNIEV
ncbi:pilus assembly protein TadB [Cohnella sp. CFH 77786]|uniref:type II secretion system F family protein n=1 Tax=Cohnella sp. CFH 77786 TaxID=2662265 RepID=UPI001C6103FD|nr:type II secretion system F family protein [Cohnella sp. CFH 77786]MBW5447084.1 pilus assembly protein TadB [Cohnella sp. CFH 77786]